MSACEKCWRDSASADDHAGRYAELMIERELADKVCTDEEQAGPDAGECPVCHRMTLHQYTREPMCGCSPESESAVGENNGT